MDQFNQYAIKYLKYGSPVILTATVLSLNGYSGSNLLYDIIGWASIVWCVLLIYIVMAIAFSDKLKNAFVRRLAGIRENDERESQITGIVSKKTFITMTGVLILLLFLSALKINIYRATDAEAINGRHGEIQFGLGLSLVTQEKSEQNDSRGRTYFIKYNGLPLTADGTLLLVMILQLGVFYYFSRSENKVWEKM